MYSSLSTLGRSQYATLPLGVCSPSGEWIPQYRTLDRSPSAGGQSDSVFLDGPPDDASLPPASPGRCCRDPAYSNGSQGDLETDRPSGFPPPHLLHHSLPRRTRGQVHSHALPGQHFSHFSISPRVSLVLTALPPSVCSEYVNQEIRDPRSGVAERPSTLPRKGSRADRRPPNGLCSGHSVEIPRALTSPAFDNPYYLDLVAKANAVAGAAAAADGPEAVERDGRGPRHVNGFVTPTAENPEYLGLAETWSGYT